VYSATFYNPTYNASVPTAIHDDNNHHHHHDRQHHKPPPHSTLCTASHIARYPQAHHSPVYAVDLSHLAVCVCAFFCPPSLHVVVISIASQISSSLRHTRSPSQRRILGTGRFLVPPPLCTLTFSFFFHSFASFLVRTNFSNVLAHANAHSWSFFLSIFFFSIWGINV
jgi:hypothetical protein